MLYLSVIDDRRISHHARVEELDAWIMRLAGFEQQPGERIFEPQSESFSERIANENDAARCWCIGNVPIGYIFETQRIRKKLFAQKSPGVVACEVGKKIVIVGFAGGSS